MLISTAYIFLLSTALYCITNRGTLAGTVNGAFLEDVSGHGYSLLQQKLDNFGGKLKQIDESLQQLHEKSNNWAIFKHNIDAWNDQLKLIEHKLEIIKRTQDEQHHKLTALELTLNHVLSKVIFLSDTDIHGPARDPAPKESKPHKHGNGHDKRVLAELSARLSNVLHHLQNIESKNCQKTGNVGNDEAHLQKLGKLLLPIGDVETTSSDGKHLVERLLRKLEQKTNILLANLQPKDIKQMQNLTKKNAKTLEGISNTLQSLVEVQRTGARNWDQMTDYCQAVSGELTTFTESSDLLLKRIELVVKDVSEKLRRSRCNAEDAGEEHTEQKHNAEEHTEQPTYDEDQYNEDSSTEPDENIELVEFVQPTKSDCSELTEPRVNGIYKFLTPDLNEAQRDFNERFCAFATDGPAWTVIQNRGPYVEQENFNRSWNEYRNGFGSLSKDFWYGNEFTYKLLSQHVYTLRIELEDFNGQQVWAEYGVFRLDDELNNYNLEIGDYRGSIQDALEYHNEMDFSTYDHQHDRSSGAACAVGYGSGWWFDSCAEANLNGIYHKIPVGHNYIGVLWEHWHGDYSLKATQMMIRPRDALVNTVYSTEIYNEFNGTA